MKLVLLSGLLSNKRVFQQQVEQLKNSIDVLVIELADVDTPAKMTNKILDLAPDRFMLAGHSIGGWVALRFMKVAPERVQKLFILSTGARGIDPEELTLRQSVLTRVENGEFQQIAAEIANKFTFNESAKKTVLDMFLQVGEQGLINQTRAMMIREDLRDILPKINCPTWVMHADQDKRFSLEEITEISNLIPHAKFKIVHNSGHMSPMEVPEQITNLLRSWVSDC